MRILLCILFVFFNVMVFSQREIINYDSRYYVLGIVNYNYITKEAKRIYYITQFRKDVIYKLYRIDSLLKKDNIDDMKYLLEDNHPKSAYKYVNYGMYSKNLFRFLKKHYSFPIIKRFFYHKGTIKKFKYRKIMCKSDIKKKSFLAGIMFNYGDVKDDKYEIRRYNQGSISKVVYRLLKSYNCTDLDYVEYKNIPHVQVISFTPSPELKLIFDNEIKIRNELKSRDFTDFIKEIEEKMEKSE